MTYKYLIAKFSSMRRIFCILIIFISSYAGSAQQLDSSGILAKSAHLTLISNKFSFTEGPAVDKKGNIYFTDQPNDKIWKFDVKKKLSLFLDKTGRSNGLYIDRKGNLLACADEHDQLWSIGKHKKITILIKNFEGKKLNGPNDIWADNLGGIYFTDPYYQRSYWSRTAPEVDGEKVYYLAPGGKSLLVVESLLKKPNGIVGTPDGKYLFVADIGANKTYKYTIGNAGKLEEKILFCNQGSDGMTLDNKGNVYLTGDGVTDYDNKGSKLGHIPIPAKWTGNLCFGGKDKNMLFITASESIFTISMNVKGVE